MNRSVAGMLCALGLATPLVAGCGGSKPSASTSAAASAPSTSSSSSAAAPSTAAAAPYGSSAAAPSAPSSETKTIITLKSSTHGKILAAGPKRLTVYLFEADKGSTSACTNTCAGVWPPVTTTSAATAQGGAIGADLGTTTRSDGTKQVTYKGHPLYYYASDRAAGDANGQGLNSFGGGWYVLSASGAKVANP
jgi:predicted lipoprotein with Yx(FWY)xxD motif